MSAIEWHEDFDDDGNSIWEGLSIFSSDEGAPDIHWRLKPILLNNCIEWYEAHDGELMKGSPESWMSLKAAKAAIQKKHDAMIAEYFLT